MFDKSTDKQIEEWIKELGLVLNRPPQAKEFFHILVTPPQGGPAIEIIRVSENSKFYIIVMGIGIHPIHISSLMSLNREERVKFIIDLQLEALRYGVDFIALPPNQEVPNVIQISKPLFMENLTANEFINALLNVRNAGVSLMLKFNQKFGPYEPQQQTSLKYT
ncbi:MAG: DUF2299 domain-containing protein [Saccharolobus sp.]